MPAPIWPAPATRSLVDADVVLPVKSARSPSGDRARRCHLRVRADNATAARLTAYTSRGRRRGRRHAVAGPEDRTAAVLLPCRHDTAAQIVSCEVLRNEIEAVLERDGRGLEVEFVDGALHDYPRPAARRGPGAHRRHRPATATSSCRAPAAATASRGCEPVPTGSCCPPSTTASRCCSARVPSTSSSSPPTPAPTTTRAAGSSTSTIPTASISRWSPGTARRRRASSPT